MNVIVVGSHVWVEDPNVAWIDGEVTAITDSNATVVITNGDATKTVVVSLSNVYPKDTETHQAGVDDMTKLAYLHEPGVLHNLSTRYALNEIYTYTGNILIAVNPFRRLPHLYDLDVMEQYKGAAFGELRPHLFAVADACYRAIINEQGSQSILVSGESGAGKTETTKMLMRYLAFMGGRSCTEGRTVEQQVLEVNYICLPHSYNYLRVMDEYCILQSNPVLEAFGNAKTVKNNNSSRFGKFVEIQFDKYGKISGAAIRTYLLERSRDAKKFKVADPRTFHYLNQTNCYDVANVDDAREYLETRNALDIVGINVEEQEAIFRVVAAILHLGNINFDKGSDGFVQEEGIGSASTETSSECATPVVIATRGGRAWRSGPAHPASHARSQPCPRPVQLFNALRATDATRARDRDWIVLWLLARVAHRRVRCRLHGAGRRGGGGNGAPAPRACTWAVAMRRLLLDKELPDQVAFGQHMEDVTASSQAHGKRERVMGDGGD
ncbi:hypothetical protein ZIOFF_037440 [Zingiber officinale]|uniref:Myosin motor domain-containing protein n=1 Tax=Zingiber officinale TaxID=94328 RepID=A0A8J5L442_ZINOF|nr:hypothetical protein ZIOFF_037440 [Zingiber officinale]